MTSRILVQEYQTLMMKIQLDIEKALVNFGGDRDLLIAIADIVVEDLPKLSKQVREAVNSSDMTLLKRYVHSVRGLVANLAAEPAVSISQQIESSIDEQVASATILHQVDSLLECLELTEPVIRDSLATMRV